MGLTKLMYRYFQENKFKLIASFKMSGKVMHKYSSQKIKTMNKYDESLSFRSLTDKSIEIEFHTRQIVIVTFCLPKEELGLELLQKRKICQISRFKRIQRFATPITRYVDWYQKLTCHLVCYSLFIAKNTVDT